MIYFTFSLHFLSLFYEAGNQDSIYAQVLFTADNIYRNIHFGEIVAVANDNETPIPEGLFLNEPDNVQQNADEIE